jgi:hypothetical protein
MARRRRKRTSSSNSTWNWKRLAYIALLLTSGSGGMGGYMLKDHPLLASILQSVLGTVAQTGNPGDVDLASQVKQVVEKTRGFATAGTFAVTIDSITLGAIEVTKAPRVQVSVRSVDAEGQEIELWGGGPRPAVRDEANGCWMVEWDDKPFELAWSPGQRIAVAVTAWTGRATPYKFYMVNGKLPGFPLRPGSFALREGSGSTTAADPSKAEPRIIFNSSRLPDTPAAGSAAQIARAPSGNDPITIQ